MIGVNLYTLHTTAVPCDGTAGLYVLVSGIGAGVLKNSECRFGAWAGWAPETNTLTIGPVKAKAGAIVGLVAGYKSNPIFPLLLPSVAVSFDGRSWLRITFIPKFKTSAGGASFSVEFQF